ncbi:B3 domain-containing protein, partial [Tanacetum coccineum]
MAASSSIIPCFNCNKSSSDQLSNGWKLRTGGFAKLCGICYSVYKDGKFCEKFHSDEDGWRECEDCTKPIHCGCIVSLRDYSFDDFRGIICSKCIWAGFKLEPSHFNTESDPLDITDLVKYYDIQPEDLVQPPTNRVPEPVLVLLFEKVLTANDAKRKHSYIIIPNKHAKAHFSEAFESERFPINILDTDGNNWDFKFRCWVNGNKKKFVIKGVTNFIIAKDLVAGDTVVFYRRESDGKIILEIRKPCAEIPTDHQVGDASVTWSVAVPLPSDCFCNSYYIPDEVHPTAPGRDRTITQFPEGKVGVYTRLFDYCGYRIPLTKFFVSVLKYFRIHISQLSPFGAARISHFEVLTRVLDLGPSVSVFRAFYTRMYSDGLFSFAKRSLSAPSCLSKPPDSIKNWADHFFWVDSRVFPISVPLYTGGVLEKDPAPHLTARQEQAVQILSSNKAPFRRYPECFLALVGLSPYYPFGENTYPAFEGPDRTDMGLLDYIRTADPRKVQAVEVQKGEEQVTLFDSIKHCFVSLDAPAVARQASGSGSSAGAEVSAPSVEGNVVEENVIPEGTFLDLTDPECDVAVVEKNAQKQPEKAKRKKLLKRSDPLPA